MAIQAPPRKPEYLKGYEQPITFSKEDHPQKVPRPGHSALVVHAQIDGYNVERVFMDGGSGINIIYADTLRRMNKNLEGLAKSDTSFHGIVPGKANYPLGSISLEVIFGKSDNYRRETLHFEVVDWPSQYHAILGRPAYARFLAVPHYAYLKLKMPGPKGPITVKGDFQKSDKCDSEFNKISQSFGMQEELEEISKTNNHAVLPEAKRPVPDDAFDATNDTKKYQVHPTDQSKTAMVSSSLPIA
jgi:hypothetical protein